MTNTEGHQYHGVDALLVRIEKVQRRRWITTVLSATVGGLGILAVGIFVVSLFGYYPDQPPSALRWCLFGMVMILLGGALGWVVLRLITGRQNPEQTARFIETACPKIGNDLINSVLLAEDKSQPSCDLVQFTINESNRHAARADLAQSIRPATKKLIHRSVVTAIAIVLLLVFAIVQPVAFSRGIQAALAPTSYVTAANHLKLIELTPGDTSVFPEEPVDIAITITDDVLPENSLTPEVVIEGEKHPRAMYPDSHQSPDTLRFILHIKSVHEPMRYFVRIRNKTNNKKSRWPTDKPWYQIGILHPKIKTFFVQYTYPDYTNLKSKTAELNTQGASIKAPVGSQAKVHFEFEAPIPKGIVEFSDGTSTELAVDEANKEFACSFPVNTNGGVRFRFFDRANRLLLQLPDNDASKGFYPISAIPDSPPNVQFITPKQNVEISPNDVLPMKLLTSDDYGISRVELWTQTPGEKASPIENFNPRPTTTGKKKIFASYTWKPTGHKVGDTIIYFATVTDNRSLGKLGEPQTVVSPKYKITIRTRKDIAQHRRERYHQLQRELLKLLHIQSRQRVNTAIASRCKTLNTMRQTGSEIQAAQKSILSRLRSLEKDFPFYSNLLDIKNAISMLADNQATTAIHQAAAVVSITDLSQRYKPCDSLGATQNSIINSLQEMLAIMPSLAKQPGELKSQDGEDLSPDAMRAKRQGLKDDLKKFIDEHQKVIEAGERLNKKPLDDFTSEDEKLLHDLINVEDKWEKFLNEKFADFSKLAEQDFANPSLLKELVSIKTDVTMAKDALEKKAVEVATACENNGVENAKTLTANIEKWLPDEPDRKKWEMEAPEDQEDIENAELPTELEDLVGDLLEEEEDLFEEMDDTTSKASMSGDKGIGWDANDGPISNMNAQGVTGNQLPNTSEIGGRSGEGRTGKASGEHVEDKAVGKGGRRTPTRLTREPFQKGQINDVSTDPPGGATGGGKLSGSGAEGLEGSVPTNLKDQQKLKALAARQASIINRAERIQAGFKTGNYARFKLSRAILLMNRVRNDLERGEYQNALRRRRGVISTLQDTQKLFSKKLGQKLEVTTDTSAAGPKYIRDNISDAMKGNLPAEYREALQEYYKRLSE